MAALNSPNVEPTPQESAPIPAEPIPKPGPLAQASQVETTVRLNVALLDSLMTVVGEPVLGRTQLNEAVRDAEFTRQVADQSPKLGKQAGYRLHPGEGNGFLQFGNHQTHAVGTGTDPLLVAGQIKRLIEAVGYKVLVAEDGQSAWELLDRHASEISVVTTDIEMPRLDGLGLTKRIRSDPRFSQLPVIALSTLAGEEEMAHGLAVGVSEYQIKLDQDQLLESIRKAVSSKGLRQSPVTA